MKRHDESMSWEDTFLQARKLKMAHAIEQARLKYGVSVMDQRKEGPLLEQFERAADLVWSRHQVIHAIWMVTKDTQDLLANHNGKPIPDTPETIEKVADALYEVVLEINNLTRPPDAPFGKFELSARGWTGLTGATLPKA